MDGVIFNTIKAIVDLYDDDFSTYKDYKKVNWEDINSWDFTELNAAAPDYINTYFNQKRFFRIVEYMPDARIMILTLNSIFDITNVSAGYSPNLVLKEQWTKKNMPFAKFIGVDLKKYKDKSHINMSGSVFVDDSASNLETSDADIKICFGKKYPWNESWNGMRIESWTQIKNVLETIYKEYELWGGILK